MRSLSTQAAKNCQPSHTDAQRENVRWKAPLTAWGDAFELTMKMIEMYSRYDIAQISQYRYSVLACVHVVEMNANILPAKQI